MLAFSILAVTISHKCILTNFSHSTEKDKTKNSKRCAIALCIGIAQDLKDAFHINMVETQYYSDKLQCEC